MRKTKEERQQKRLLLKLNKLSQFSKALASHIVRGMPKANEVEIRRRFEICQSCLHFTGESCRICGCGVNAQQQLMNKLSWADQQCPDNPRKW